MKWANVSIRGEGIARNTKVSVDDREIVGVQRIEIDPVECGGLLTARITVMLKAVDLKFTEADILASIE
jgi:hypothetical protein